MTGRLNRAGARRGVTNAERIFGPRGRPDKPPKSSFPVAFVLHPAAFPTGNRIPSDFLNHTLGGNTGVLSESIAETESIDWDEVGDSSGR